MIKKIFQFWQGHLEVEIRGNALARFINQVNELDIRLWNIKRINYDCYHAYIYKDNFNKLRPLLRKRKCQVKIIKKRGLPFFLQKIRKRVFLFIGLILFLAIFYIGSSYMWFYEINGLENIKEDEIIELLNDIGLRRGILKNKIDTLALENYLQKENSKISWVNIKWIGTQLYIDIVEKKLLEPVQTGDLLAAKDGVISEIIVLKGQAAVKKGDTVSKGQVLIVPERVGGEARGIVKADIWYDAIGEANYYNETILTTGRLKTFWGIKIGTNIYWLSELDSSFDKYKRKRELKNIFRWRNISLPIELIKEEHIEIVLIKAEKSPESTLFGAKEKAFFNILPLLKDGSVIDYVNYEIIESEEKDKIMIRLLMKVEENIAVLREDFNGRN